MANLKEIEDTLNSNPDEAKKFQADPVGYLEGKGVHLPEAAKTQLVENVKAHAGTTPKWNVGIMAASK